MERALFTGHKIPLVGLGTWKSKKGEVAAAVKVALKAGYRHIDCAAAYGNEKEVGVALHEAITSGAVKREQLFVTSKLWNTKHRACDVKPSLQQTLSDLRLEYLDLYLIHWPMAFRSGTELMPKNPDGSMAYSDTHFLETWEAMEELVEAGLTRHIGLSNFNSQQISEVCSKCRVKPAVVQCESHPYLTQEPLIAHCQMHDIVFEAYSPLGSPDRPWAKPGDPALLEDPNIVEIGHKYGKSPAQVLIRFQVERGVVVLPKSVTPERIRSNLSVLDFSLSAEDMTVLKSFDRNWRACLPKAVEDGQEVPRDRHHPHYPFNIPF